MTVSTAKTHDSNKALTELDLKFNQIIMTEIRQLIGEIETNLMIEALVHDNSTEGETGWDFLQNEKPYSEYLNVPFVFKSDEDREICRARLDNELWLDFDKQNVESIKTEDRSTVIDGFIMKAFIIDVFTGFLTYIAHCSVQEGVIIPGLEQHEFNADGYEEIVDRELSAFTYADYY